MNFLLKYSRYLIILLSAILVFSFLAQNYKNFEQINSKVEQLKKAEKYQEAISLLDNISNEFPEEQYTISKELAFLYSKIGQYEKSIKIWKAGHQRSYFYGIFPHFPIYKPFKQFSQFNDVVNEDERLRNKAIEQSKTIYEIIFPENYNPDHIYPLFLILHGGGSSIQQAKKYWNSPKLNKEYIRAFIQSYMFLDMTTYSWGIKDERARKDIKDCFDSLLKEYSVDKENVIIGGVSAGGYTAMDIAIHEIIQVKGFFAVCPETETSDYDKNYISKVVSKGLKGNIIYGSKDYLLNKQQEVFKFLTKEGLNIRFNIIPDMGHHYPPSFGSLIDSAIKFLEK